MKNTTPNSENKIKNKQFDRIDRREKYPILKMIAPFLVTISVVIIIIVYSRYQRKEILEYGDYTVDQIASNVADEISSQVAYSKSSIMNVSNAISVYMTAPVLNNPGEVIEPLIESTPFSGIEYIRSDGMNILTKGEAFDASDRVYYKEGIKGNTGIWNNYTPRSSKETLVNFYTPVKYEGQTVGVVTGYLLAESNFIEIMEQDFFNSEVNCILYDEDGMIIATTLDEYYKQGMTLEEFLSQFGDNQVVLQQFLDIMNTPTEGAIKYKDVAGEGRICVKPIEGTNWKVCVLVSAQSFNAVYGSFVNNTVRAVFLVIVILFLYLAHVMSLSTITKKKMQQANEVLEISNSEQFSVLKSMAEVFYSIHLLDLKEDTVKTYLAKNMVKEAVNDSEKNATEMMRKVMSLTTAEQYKEAALEFTDLTTLANRMQNKKTIEAEFIGVSMGWFAAQFITIETDEEQKPTKVVYTTKIIENLKKEQELLIKKSETDEMTGFYNRRAYEEDIYAHNNMPNDDNFVYVALDINGLKIVNDNLGHEAGDELISGACECMRRAFGAIGKLYRVGGDEFVAILNTDDSGLDSAIKYFENAVSNWQGKLVDSVSVSLGHASKNEFKNASVRELAAIADKRMYEEKALHYQKQGMDRRGQQDAHKALCALYSKILKINITDDTYQILNFDENERDSAKGFSEESISEWLKNFGNMGQVHPYDLAEYLEKTDIKNISEYFKNHNEPLHIFYKRKYGDEFKQTLMEIIPASDYTDENQSLYLYVKQIGS